MKNVYLENKIAEEKRIIRRKTFWGFFIAIIFTGLTALAIVHIINNPIEKTESYENQRRNTN